MAAGKIVITTRISWTKDGGQIIATTSSSATQSGDQAIQNVQIVGSTSEAVNFGDVTTPGWVGFKNLNADEGATVHVGTTNPVTSGNAQFTFAPGEGTAVQTTQAAWYAISSTGSTNLLVTAIEA